MILLAKELNTHLTYQLINLLTNEPTNGLTDTYRLTS